MKNIFLLILCSISFIPGVFAKNIEAYFNYCTFQSPQSGPYIETYLSIIGNSLLYKKNDGNKKAELEITIIFRQNDEIADFKKFVLTGPYVSDTLDIYPNFIDQQRFSLPSGNYEIDIEIVDLNNPVKKKFFWSEPVEINFPPEKISISDVQLIESFTKSTKSNILTKSGYDLVPYVSSFYPKSMSELVFYAEVYNTQSYLGKDEKYLINYYIETAERSVKLPNYNSFARKNTSDVAVVLGEFPIDQLTSGNYNLVIEARDKNNELLSQKKVFFQRSNTAVELNLQDLANINTSSSFVSNFNSKDTLADYIKSVWPISNMLERTFADNQLKSADLELMQKFFYSFWSNRDPLDPEKAWKEYQIEVRKVNEHYGNKIRKGYETDRGRVYLQYGPPNTISRQYNEPGTYPYEIWHYYHIAQFNNRRFVFYNPDIATNEFPLLHSDMFGEVNNPRWQIAIQGRYNQVLDLDTERLPGHYGGNADDFFTAPR
jgi:GWxTD domain-containing protein